MQGRKPAIATKFSPAIACDVSYYQCAVDSRYPRYWLIYRACDGTFRDPNFAANHAWAVAATQRKVHRLRGHLVYVVYRPGVDVFSVLKSMCPNPDSKMVVMIDVESWGGRITGDHSAEISALANQLAAWLGSQKRVLVYGNVGDLTTLYRNRLAWLRCVVAAYSSVRPSFPNMIGWQYSDGQAKWPHPANYPIATAPFGNCDHNVFPFHTIDTLAEALGVADPPKKPVPVPPPAPAPKPVPVPTPKPPTADTAQEDFDKRMHAYLTSEAGKRDMREAVLSGRFVADENGDFRTLTELLSRIQDGSYRRPSPKPAA